MNIATVKEMRHCIGLDTAAPKRGVYRAHRNYCNYYVEKQIWKELIYAGYGKCETLQVASTPTGKSYWYSLTREGLDLMEAMIGAKIIESW